METENNNIDVVQTNQENENRNKSNENLNDNLKENEQGENSTSNSKLSLKNLMLITSIAAGIFFVLTVVFIVLYATKDSDKDTTSYKTKEEYITSTSGEKIYSKIYLPKKKNSYSVILCHGFGGTHEDMEDYAKILANNKFVTLVFDFRGGGPNSKSDGKTTDMTPLTEKQDLSDVYEYLVKQSYAKKGKIYLIGNSQGGFVSTLYAADNKDNIAGLLLLFPALVIPDNMRTQYPDLSTVSDVIENYLGIMDIGKAYITSVYDIQAYDYLKTYDKQVIILHGIEDTLVPYTSSVNACENYGTTCRLILYEGGDHGLNGEVPRKKSLQDTLHFFNDLKNGVF